MADRRVRFGVLGAGGIARRKTIPGMLAAGNCQLVAVMDPVEIDQIAAQFQVPRAYQRAEDLLADPAVEAVYIASPVSYHAEQIELAAHAGKHVLCEKPLTLNLAQAHGAVEQCRSRGVFLQEGYMMKFHGAHRHLKQLIDGGHLGKLTYLRAQLSCWYPPIEGAWRQRVDTGGGGALIDMASHLYDLLEYLAGPVRSVCALTGNLVQEYESEDASTTLLEFMSGAHATVDCFFCIPDEASRTRLEIYGSQGAALSEGTIGQGTGGTLEVIRDLAPGQYDAQQNKDVVREFRKVQFEQVNPYTAQCEYFADCILRDTPPELNNSANAIRLMTLVEAAYQSARTRQAVSVIAQSSDSGAAAGWRP